MSNYSPLLALFVLAPRLRRASNRAVSIYLPARSEGYDARFYDIEFRDLLHRYNNRLSEKDRELMEYELRRLRHHPARGLQRFLHGLHLRGVHANVEAAIAR